MKTTLPSFGLVALLSLVTVGRADVIEIDSSNPVESGHFGGSCSGIPDLDGDAVGDFIVGGWLETVGSTPFAGRVYVYSGKDWSLIHTHISPHVEFQGGYGQSVVGIGDINGDGRGDYIVGSENEDVGGFINSGRVYVYSGASGTLIRTHAMPGIMSFARFGHDVDAVPDLTNDGRPDYIVGAEGVNTSSNGQAFLFDGATGLLVRTIDPPDSADASFGMSVAGIPDINGDGRGDYAVGAPYADPGQSPADSGRVYVFSGVNGALAHTFAPPAPTLSGRFGWALAGIHDAGGDGLGDLLIGVPFDSVGPVASAGRAYIYSCASALLTQTFLSPTLESNGQFGRSIVGVGDRNGDGLEDVLIGAPGVGGGPGSSPGRAYVMDGDDGALLLTLQPTTANSGDQAFGVAVGAVPDVTGDGLPDFVVGADEEEGSGGLLNEGRVYLVRDVPNDSCESLAASTPLFEGVQSFTNVGATGGGSGPECDGEHLGSDIWFAFQATCDGLVTIQSCSDASFDTLLAVYEGCDVTLPGGVCVIGGPLACDDDGCGGARRGAAVSFPASSGECFRVRVGGFDGEQGQGSLVLECFLSCPGDLDTSGSVSTPDVRLFLDAWGGSDPLADLNDNGVIDADDLAILLGNWGPC